MISHLSIKTACINIYFNTLLVNMLNRPNPMGQEDVGKEKKIQMYKN